MSAYSYYWTITDERETTWTFSMGPTYVGTPEWRELCAG